MYSLRGLVVLIGACTFTSYVYAWAQCASVPQHFLSQQESPLCWKEEEKVETEYLGEELRYEHPIWSHKAFCVRGEEKEYCTHTTSSFRDGHGLSVIASPVAADAISSALAASRNAPRVSEDGLEVRSVQGKGKGLTTTRLIKKGETILLDSPRIIASAQFPSHVSHSQGQTLFNTALDQLPTTDRHLILPLDKSLGGTDIENIMKTNAFACYLSDGDVEDGYMCLFPSVARINHACRPNAHARFIPRTLLMEIKAQRDIEAGEEISISYGKIELKYAERQRLYKEGWNFTCTCSSCTASRYDIAGSDQRRARFAKLRMIMESLTAETYDAQQVVAWEKEVMEISKKEGLDTLLAGDYERLAYVYAGHEMVRDAKIWAIKAKESLMEWIVVDGGPQNELWRVEELLAELSQ
ncbi:SET domain-containing protein [Clathrospora elynae]|uniref:SET domain-containing protein n=1 Tax=Clathrospora elynae TaxID=706981 RepID=A0A6A5SKI5_9PLEO|nr:SET domain-containing protein [Clathrospora elynae]